MISITATQRPGVRSIAMISITATQRAGVRSVSMISIRTTLLTSSNFQSNKPAPVLQEHWIDYRCRLGLSIGASTSSGSSDSGSLQGRATVRPSRPQFSLIAAILPKFTVLLLPSSCPRCHFILVVSLRLCLVVAHCYVQKWYVPTPLRSPIITTMEQTQTFLI